MKCSELRLWKKQEFGSKIIWDSYYFIAKNCEIVQKATPEVGEKIETIELNFKEFIKFTQKENFRNKTFSDMVFRMIHTKGELERFEKELFE